MSKLNNFSNIDWDNVVDSAVSGESSKSQDYVLLPYGRHPISPDELFKIDPAEYQRQKKQLISGSNLNKKTTHE